MYNMQTKRVLCVIVENENINPFHTQACQVIECPQADTINVKTQKMFWSERCLSGVILLPPGFGDCDFSQKEPDDNFI